MAGRKTVRLQVTLPEELVRNIDRLCAISGMTRSAWVEYTLGTSITTYLQMVEKTSEGLATVAKE